MTTRNCVRKSIDRIIHIDAEIDLLKILLLNPTDPTKLMKIITICIFAITIADVGYSFYFDLPLDLFYVGSVFMLGGFTLRLMDEKGDVQGDGDNRAA